MAATDARAIAEMAFLIPLTAALFTQKDDRMLKRKVNCSLNLIGMLLLLFIGVAPANSSDYSQETASSSDCSRAILKGRYANIERGTQSVGPLSYPYASIGSAIFDGKGKWEGTGTTSLGGKIISGSNFSGTYNVNPNCTFSSQFGVKDPDTFHIVGTIAGTGQFQEVHYNYTDDWMIASATLKKTPGGGCSLATVRGSYALFGEGTRTHVPASPVPVNHTGVVTFDGKGHFLGQATSNEGGKVKGRRFKGKYTVNSECTLKATITFSNGSVLHEEGIITGESPFTEIHTIITDSGWVFADVFKKQ
jgi:hypothetical protein